MKPEELYQQYLFWRHEGLEPIIAIDGFTTFLLEGYLGGFTKEQQKIIQLILLNSRIAIQGWNDFGEFLRAEYHFEKKVEQYLFLPKVIEKALDNLRQCKYLGKNESIIIELSDSLTLARVNPLYAGVFFYLLAPSFKLKDGIRFTPKILINEINSSSIGVQIQSGVWYFSIPEYSIEHLYPNTDIILAKHILQNNDIPLKVEIVNGENEPLTVVNFEFEIPIYNNGLQEPNQEDVP